MIRDVFVDTNVLVYDQDTSEPAKQPLANRWIEHLWRSGRGRLSAQVLSEYYITVTRKLQPGRGAHLARADVRDLHAWRPIALDAGVIELAWDIEDRYALSWWDALIAAAAQAGGCRYLLTEDLHDGLVIFDLTVIDPFAHDLAAIDAGA